MNIFITGGAGYVGTKLTKALLNYEQVDKIIIYDNLSRNNFNLFLGKKFLHSHKVQFVNGDLLDTRKVRKLLEGVDFVYHLAAKVTTPFDNNDAHFHEQVNHWGTSELVMAMEESKIKKFVYTSSTSVYGASDDFVNEQTQPDPKTIYGISKLRGEEHVRRLFEKMNTYILRCGNVYGYSKSMRFDAVINRFMFDANFNHRISIHGNGDQSRAFIHVDILTDLLAKFIVQPVPSGIYNVVDKNVKVIEIAELIRDIYEDLELIFINQHLKLRELKVRPESMLREFIDFSNPLNLKEELKHFKDRFAF